MSIQETIQRLLNDHFSPDFLSVENESHQHNVPPGSESHFKVVIASDQFLEKRPVQRHQAVNAVLMDIIKNQIHALALHTYTVAEWAQQNAAPESPLCMGGSKKTN